MATLKDVKVGESATVARLNGTGASTPHRWTWALPRAPHVCMKRSRSVTHIRLTVRGYELSIRRDEAANVEVTDVGTGSRSGACEVREPRF